MTQGRTMAMNFWNAFCYRESEFYGVQRQAARDSGQHAPLCGLAAHATISAAKPRDDWAAGISST